LNGSSGMGHERNVIDEKEWEVEKKV